MAVPSAGILVQSGPERPVPVASLTKIMTAYLVLKDHPLSATALGPVVTMTPTDVAEVALEEANNDTSVPVVAGEQLTERQLLAGLIVHSANNFADTLARWDAGSIGAFVAKMNAEARVLGMRNTHYVDTNGIHAGSVSTAADQLRLTERALAQPAFAAVAAQPTVTEPLAGLLANYVPAVGTDGVVGVKSGFTQAALGCMVIAARRQVGGRQVLVLAATTGQPGFNALGTAQTVDLNLVNRAAAALRVRTVVPQGTVVAAVHTSWPGPAAGDLVRTTRPVDMVLWPGTTVHRVATTRRLVAPVAAGTVVGALAVTDGTEQVQAPIAVSRQVGPPGLLWRLWR